MHHLMWFLIWKIIKWLLSPKMGKDFSIKLDQNEIGQNMSYFFIQFHLIVKNVFIKITKNVIFLSKNLFWEKNRFSFQKCKGGDFEKVDGIKNNEHHFHFVRCCILKFINPYSNLDCFKLHRKKQKAKICSKLFNGFFKSDRLPYNGSVYSQHKCFEMKSERMEDIWSVDN